MLRLTHSFSFNGVAFQVFVLEKAGDVLPVHEHDFNHLTRCEAGEIEALMTSGPKRFPSNRQRHEPVQTRRRTVRVGN